MLEPSAEDLASETLMVEDWWRVLVAVGDDDDENGSAPKKESPASDQRMRSALEGSLTILSAGDKSGRSKGMKGDGLE